MAGIKFDITGDNKNFLNSLNGAQRGVTNAIGIIEKAGRGIESTFTRIKDSALGGFADIAKGMMGLTAMLQAGNFFKTLIDDASKFNVAMKEVSTLSDDVANHLQNYKDKVVDMSTEIAIAPVDAAKALYQIESAGHHGADGLNILRESAKGAIGGVTDTATAADAITTILNAYKKDASEAQHISDLLFTTVRLGKTNMTELGHSISQVAPVAAAYGVSIEDVLAAIASLTKQGTPTAIAIRQVRDAITATTASLGDAAFQGRSFLDAMDDVAKKSQGSQNALKDDLSKLGAINAVLALTGKNAVSARQDMREMQDSAGAAEAAYEKMASTAGTQTTLLRNNIFKNILPIANEMKAMSGEIAGYLNEAFDSGAMDTALTSLEAFIAAYAVYRGLLVTTTAWNTAALGGTYQLQIAELQKLIPLKELDGQADLQAAVAKGTLTTEQAKLVASLRAETEARYEEIMAAESEARANLKALTAAEASATANVTAAEEMVAAAQARVAAATQSGVATDIDTAKEELNTAEMLRNDAMRQKSIVTRQREGAQTMVNITAKNAETAATLMNTTNQGANTVATGILATAKLQLKKAIDAVNSSFLASPLFWMAATIAAVTYAVYKLVTAESAHDAAVRKTNEALEEQKKQLDERKNSIDGLIRTIQDSNATSYQKIKAYDELKDMASDITEAYSMEALATMEAADAQKILNESMDDAEYEELVEKVRDAEKAYKDALKAAEAATISSSYGYYDPNADYSGNQLIEAETNLNTLRAALAKVEEMREEARKAAQEAATPIEIRIEAAKENEAEQKRIFDFYDDVISRVDDIQSSHNKLNFDEAKSKLDDYISEVEVELAYLHTQAEQNPIDEKIRLEEEEKTNLLNNLVLWKQQMAAGGYTTIPLMFKSDWGSAQAALNAATGFYQNLITQTTARGTQSMADLYKKAKKDYNTALAEWKRVSDPKNRANITPTDFNNAKSTLATAKSAYEAVGGDPDGKLARAAAQSRRQLENENEKAAKQSERLFEQQLAERERQAKQRQDMEDAIANAAIAGEQNRAKRELMQTEKDHSDALADIDRQAEEMRKANYEAQKKAWEAANTDNTKSWADTDIAKSVAEHGYKVIALTEAQNETLKALREKENADYARYFEERLKIEDGSRQAVIDAMEEGTAKEIAQINLDKELKLKAVKEQYEELKEAKEASARAVAEANGELFDPSSVDFSDIDEWYKKQLKAIAASYSKSMGEIKENNQSSLDQLVLQYGQYADKKAVIERQGEEKIKKLRKQYAAAITDEERQRISEMIMLTEEGTEKQLEQLDEEYDKTKEKVDKLTTALGETIQTVTELGSAMKDLFDIDEADYAKLTKGMKSVQSLAEGIGKIKTGDYLSGGLGILSGLMNAMSLLSGDDDSYRQQVLERIDRHLEVSNKNIEKLTGTLEKSYGNTAWKLGEKAATELTKSVSEVLRALSQMDDLPRHLKDTLGTIGGGGRGYDSTGLPGHGSGWNTGNKRNGEGALDYEWIQNNKQAIIEAINALKNPAYTLSEDTKKYLEELEKLLEQIDELEKSINEQLTGTTAENVYDDFLNSLYDLADGSEDVMDDIADNWQKMVNRMVVNNIVGESFRKQLTETKGDQKSWYDRMAELQHQFSEGIIDNTAYREAMKVLMDEYNGYVADAQGQIQTLTEEGIIKPIGEAKKYFSNLRDMWLSTLTDMKADAKSWQKEITRIMVEDLINSLVLGDDFEAWLADWKKRYADELAHGGDADRLKALVDEMVAKRKELAEQSQGIMDDLGYSDMIKEIEESEDVFEDLHSYFLDALMDMDTDAEEWGKKIGETLARQIIEQQMLSQAFDGLLDEWKSAVADLVQNDFGHIDGDEQTLDMLKGKIAEIVEKYKELAPLAQEFLEALGLVEESKPETPFKNLRQSFLNSLLDMKYDAESFRRELDKTLVQDMIEKFIFDVKLTVNGQDFDNFDGYLEDWNRRYLEIFQNVELTQEQKESQLQALIDELMVERDLLDQASADLRERLKEPDDTFKTMSDGWVSTLLDMDATAEDWAKEIGRTMARKIIEQMMVTSMIQPLLDNLQDAFNTAMSRDGATWESVLPELTPYIEEIKEAFGGMQPMVEQILNSFGIFKDDTITSMRENWLSALMDMKAGTADFVNDIKRLLTQKLVEKLVLNSQFDTWLEGIQSQYDAILNSDMSEEQAAAAMNKLAAEWEAKAKEMQEQTQAIFDLTGWSAIVEQMNSPLADLRSSFRSALMDMENDTEDFTNEISKLLTEAFIDRFVLGDEFDKRLSEWQEQYAAIMKGNYSEEERASLLKQLQEAIAAAKEGYAAEAAAIHEFMGTANYTDQGATMNMSDKITYEQADQLLGINMAQELTLEQILATLQGGDIGGVRGSDIYQQMYDTSHKDETAKQILAVLQSMRNIASAGSSDGYGEQIFNRLGTTNDYLRAIRDDVKAYLGNIAMYTANLVKL